MKKCLFAVFVMLLFLTGIPAQADNNKVTTVQDPLYFDLSKTTGFLIGQHLSLEKIKRKFPDLAQTVQIASLNFDSAFGTANKAISEELQSIMKEHYPKFISDTKSKLEDNNASQIITHDVAVKFIEDAESRAHGNIPSPFLETLLTYQYENNPSEEFSRKFIRTYSTKGHTKAQGLDLTINYPISWKAAEAERPNIIQKFTSHNGRGLEFFNIMAKDLPLSLDITAQELDELYTESELKGMIPKDGRFISAKPIILDNHKAGVILFDQTVQRLDTSMTMRTQMYVTVIKNKMVFLHFMVASQTPDTQVLQARFKKFEPLFRMTANSFIIQEQYTTPGYTPTGSTKNVPNVKSSADNSPSAKNTALYLIITWMIGLLPPVIIRFFVWKKPLRKWPAIIVAGVFWMINLIIFGLLGSQGKNHFEIYLIAWLSYQILKYGHKATPTTGQ